MRWHSEIEIGGTLSLRAREECANDGPRRMEIGSTTHIQRATKQHMEACGRSRVMHANARASMPSHLPLERIVLAHKEGLALRQLLLPLAQVVVAIT